MKKIVVLSLILVLMDILDSLTTWIGFNHGLYEANPIANGILSFSPLLFWIGGTLLYGLIVYLVYQVSNQHPRLRWSMFIFLALLVTLKTMPVLWNTMQILIMRGVIQ
jgi:predicted membrane channel-forming protein YqfA (hemolysin III family)